MAMVDVDFDGDLDLICGNVDSIIQSSQNRLYLNDGTGVFSDATGTQMPFGAIEPPRSPSPTSTRTATST